MSLFSKNKSDKGDIYEINPFTPKEGVIPAPERHPIDIEPEKTEEIFRVKVETSDSSTVESKEASVNNTVSEASPAVETSNTAEGAHAAEASNTAEGTHEDEAIKNFTINQEAIEEQLEKAPVVAKEPVKTEPAAPRAERKKWVSELPEEPVKKKKAKPVKEERDDDDDDDYDEPSFLGNVLRFLTSLIILAVLLFAAFVVGRKSVILPEIPAPTAIPSVTPIPEVTRYKVITDLKKYAESIPEEDIAPFKATVTDYYGYEYLSLSNGEISLLYRNEYEKNQEKENRIVLDNGKFRTEMSFDLDIQKDIKLLVPKIGPYGANGSKMLVFVDYDENSVADTLWFIDADHLMSYGSLKVRDFINTGYTTTLSEEQSTETEEAKYILNFNYGDVEYLYKVSKTTYVAGTLDGLDTINVNDGYELVFGEKSITFSTLVKTVEDEYLGLISGTVSQGSTDFSVSNLRFGSFSRPCDAGYSEDGCIVPFDHALSTYVTIIGKGHRYYLPISDEVSPIDIDWNNIVKEANGTFTYVVDGEVKSIMGIDVSKFQGKIDWKKVKEAGVEFAIIRLGYRGYGQGTLEMDEFFDANVKGATEVGIKVGVYFFSEAITVEEGVEEAQFVLSKIKNYKIEYPVVFDTEDYATVNARANNLSFQLRTDITRAFCDTIKAAGYKPMIYANSRFMLTAIDLTQLNDIDRWFAYYGTTSTFPYSFTMFQYSESGKIDGINGNVDLDISFIDYSQK